MNTDDDDDDVNRCVAIALQEDMGSGDISAHLIDSSEISTARVICRETAILCGQAWFNETFRQLNASIEIRWHVEDGQPLEIEHMLCEIKGPARALLTGERTALNFLQTLSATATLARRYADAVSGTNTKVLDTRKTIPGLRNAQKYAVRCGGCHNHRMGLFDAILIKENHIMASGSITTAVKRSMERFPDKLIEVEVENFEQIEEALQAGCRRLLLDNMSTDELKSAVSLVAGRAQLEASGGIDLQNIREIALTGVDFISVGGLTKNVQAIDLSMRFEL